MKRCVGHDTREELPCRERKKQNIFIRKCQSCFKKPANLEIFICHRGVRARGIGDHVRGSTRLMCVALRVQQRAHAWSDTLPCPIDLRVQQIAYEWSDTLPLPKIDRGLYSRKHLSSRSRRVAKKKQLTSFCFVSKKNAGAAEDRFFSIMNPTRLVSFDAIEGGSQP